MTTLQAGKEFRPVNRVLNERENDDYTASDPRDREISLGTPMLLGIFFALALLCAVFFGFGYSVGTRHAAPPVVARAEEPLGTTTGGAKPSAFGQPGKPASASSVAVPYDPSDGENTAKAQKSAEPVEAETRSEPGPIVRVASNAPPSGVSPPVATSVTVSMVQVAAVSHQEDADLLVNTLKRRGYDVAIHQEPQDKLLHVQVGPFSTRKDAEAMRQKLLADGFNAIVK